MFVKDSGSFVCLNQETVQHTPRYKTGSLILPRVPFGDTQLLLKHPCSGRGHLFSRSSPLHSIRGFTHLPVLPTCSKPLPTCLLAHWVQIADAELPRTHYRLFTVRLKGSWASQIECLLVGSGVNPTWGRVCKAGHNEFDVVSGYLSGMSGRQVGLELKSERRTEAWEERQSWIEWAEVRRLSGDKMSRRDPREYLHLEKGEEIGGWKGN